MNQVPGPSNTPSVIRPRPRCGGGPGGIAPPPGYGGALRSPVVVSERMTEHPVERPRHAAKVKRVDEEPRVFDLPAAAGTHAAMKLLLDRASSLRGLLLERPERAELALRVEDRFDRGGTESANELVFEVPVAHVETEPLHVGACEVGSEACVLYSAPEFALLSRVAEPCKADVEALGAVELQEWCERLRPTHGHDRNPLGVEVHAPSLGKCL